MSASTCPTCGRLVVFTWRGGERPSPETPLCTPIESPDCWPRDSHEWEQTFECTDLAPIWSVLDATHTFDIAASDGDVVPAAEIARMTGINLQDEFAEVVTTAAACA